MLCNGRPEGFGPHSSLSSPIPTTCFVDTVLIPLPVWLAMVSLPIIFFLSLHHRRIKYNPSTAHIRSRPLRSRLYTGIVILYYLLIAANILMQTLEIVRLSLIHYSVADLPFTYVGLILGALLHCSEGMHGRVRVWQAVNGVIWVGGIIMDSVKVAGLVAMGINGRKGSKYPVSDQVIDVAVMAGVYAALGLLEVVIGVRRARKAKLSRGENVGSGNLVQHSEDWISK